MPIRGARYRVKTTKTGKKVRLAFKGEDGEVVEAKNLKTGATHTPEEFAADKKRRKKKGKKKGKKVVSSRGSIAQDIFGG